MKKLLPALAFIPMITAAQNFHFSGRFGLAGYRGDLKAHPITLSQLDLMGSIGARYDFTEHIAGRSYITYGKLHAADSKGTTAMQQRNLGFETKLLDWELGGQYNILDLNEHWWTPYVFAGIGFYHFNPYTKDAVNDKVYLKELSTEGQGFIAGVDNYKLTQFSIPFGFGGDYSLNEDMRVGLEFGYRKIFTDYLDDVSTNYVDQTALLNAKGQTAVNFAWRGDEYNGAAYPAAGTVRGNPGTKDGYYYVALTFTIRYFFDKYKQTSGIPGARKEKRVGCPATRH